MKVVDETAGPNAAYAMVLQTYDRYDRPIESIYFKADETPAIGPEGSNKVIREYTSRDQVSLVRYFDENGNAIQVDGVYGINKEYNAYANLEVKTWLDADGNPVKNAEGYAKVRYDYDLSDITSAEKYFRYYLDEEGNPTQALNDAWGQTMVYYPITRLHTLTYVDRNGIAMMTKDGYATLEYEEDENGNKPREWYYDEIHAAVNCADGYASVERGFDSEGRLISERYSDRYNRRTNNKDGVASWNGYYDSEGNLVITNRYDQDLKQLPLE